MPYRKRYRRKKAPRRRRRVKRRRRTTRVMRMPSLIPDQVMVRLKYRETQNFTLGVGSQQLYALNDLFDPDITGVGHQPLGFDQWMAFYSNFEVMSSTIRFTVFNEGNSMGYLIGVFPSLTIPGFAATTGQEQPYARFKVGAGASQGDESIKFSNSMTVRKLEGRTTASVNFVGSASASPSFLRYWVIQYIAIDGSSTLNLYCNVLVTYYAKLFRRITQTQS